MPHKSYTNLQQMLQELISPSPLQAINHPLLTAKNLTLSIKRDDLLHTDISGNKWRKLKFNLLEARKQGKNHILSFGGAYSNHIHALAAAGFYFGFQTSAIIRGEPHYANNPTLKQAQQWGMKLHFVTRKEYQKRADLGYLQQLQLQFPEAIIVPEGGSNALAIQGVKELCHEIKMQTDKRINHVLTATGSGGTLAGLIAGFSGYDSEPETKITGIAVLKEAQYLNQKVVELLAQAEQQINTSWQLQTQFHGGGYAKVSEQLAEFCLQFENRHGIPIEPIYTGKMLFALFELIKKDYFCSGDNIIAIHTGGLQGLRGLKSQGNKR